MLPVHDDGRSLSSSGSIDRRRFFRPTSLGRPPGGLSNPPTLSGYSPTRQPVSNNNNKTAPFKELEKMIADLKKENFDLKLRLFHMNRLEQENEQLTLALEEQRQQRRGNARSVHTQTLFIDVSPFTYYTAFETSPEAFGLTPQRTSPPLSEFDDDVERVMDAFASVRIESPDPIRGWLDATTDDVSPLQDTMDRSIAL
ncbi:hypothetical protein BJV82DRAFT_664789 [Fennellomyces sp. T-0311]|nr:hypothetical protein BJV82DRAFT_664789 [Fennellomyces sp. T-0311]